jgi:hypothetical protein
MRTAALVAVLLAVAGAIAGGPALASHGSSRISVGVGFGFGYPYWGSPWGPWGPWGYPYYPYYAAPVVVQQAPVTYIEQNSSAPSSRAADAGWWYYCDQSRGYYPYVRECPTGWQRVPPAPGK